jgi:hypothetical protein
MTDMTDEVLGTHLDVDEVFAAYVEAAMWAGADYDESGELVWQDLRYRYTLEDFDPYLLERERELVAAFVRGIAPLAHGLTATQVGHDLWFTRNRHGTGFWDRGLGYRGDLLTEMAHSLGECNLWPDDGVLYFH